MRIKNQKQLEDEMRKRIQAAMEHEVADYVKERLAATEKRSVLDRYTPKEYERREDGLGNVENIKTSVREMKSGKIVLRVTDLTPLDGPRLEGYRQTKPYALTEIIEYGARNPWNYRNYVWMKSRPFLEDTVQYLKNHSMKIEWMIKRRFEK